MKKQYDGAKIQLMLNPEQLEEMRQWLNVPTIADVTGERIKAKIISTPNRPLGRKKLAKESS